MITRDCPMDQVCIDGFCRIPIECLGDDDCMPPATCNERGQCR